MSNTSLDSSATAVPNDVDGDRKINTSAANVGDLVRIAVKPKDLLSDKMPCTVGFVNRVLRDSLACPGSRAVISIELAVGSCPRSQFNGTHVS